MIISILPLPYYLVSAVRFFHQPYFTPLFLPGLHWVFPIENCVLFSFYSFLFYLLISKAHFGLRDLLKNKKIINKSHFILLILEVCFFIVPYFILAPKKIYNFIFNYDSKIAAQVFWNYNNEDEIKKLETICTKRLFQKNRDSCWHNLVFKGKESKIKYCSNILNNNSKDMCFNLVLSDANLKFDELDCEKINNSDLDYKNFCLARAVNNKQYCHEINDEFNKNRCLQLWIAINQLDLNQCLTLEDKENKDYCFERNKFNAKSVDECRQITQDNIKYQCLAFLNKDISQCDQILDNNQQNDCFEELELKLSDYENQKNIHHILGPEKAKIIIIEYADLKNPISKKIHSSVLEIIKKYPELQYEYRHFNFGDNESAEAAECVYVQKNDQGFFQFIDEVYKKQELQNTQPYSNKNLYISLAKQLGIKKETIKSCLEYSLYLYKTSQDGRSAAQFLDKDLDDYVRYGEPPFVVLQDKQKLERFRVLFGYEYGNESNYDNTYKNLLIDQINYFIKQVQENREY